MKKNNLLLILLGLFLFVAGCSTTQIIRTEPPGAKIYVDNKLVGKAPVPYKFKTTGFRYTYNIRAELDNFYPEEMLLQSHTDFWGNVHWSDVYLRLRRLEDTAPSGK